MCTRKHVFICILDIYIYKKGGERAEALCVALRRVRERKEAATEEKGKRGKKKKEEEEEEKRGMQRLP